MSSPLPSYSSTSTVEINGWTSTTSSTSPASKVHRFRPLVPEEGDIYLPTNKASDLEMYVRGRWVRIDGNSDYDLDPDRPMDVELD